MIIIRKELITMNDKKTDNKTPANPPKENTASESTVFSPIPLKLTTYTDHSSEAANTSKNISDQNKES